MNINAPLYKAIMEYSRSNPTIFHMPGHKLGKGIPLDYVQNLLHLDVTEIPGTDNLHLPQGVIGEAQERAAEAFGSDKTHFLVNGSTSGVHAMVLAMCRPGDKLIVSRNCHKSVIAGMMLAGVNPVYIKPEIQDYFGIPTAIPPSAVEAALEEHPDAVGVLITSPNYYGICCDVETISHITRSRGKILAVDEAHGCHLKFNSSLPQCSMEAGADICVQSAHKTLPALTQGAYLHIRGSSVDKERLEFYLGTLQTSSPSYIIMTFLDIARAIMERDGFCLIEDVIKNTSWLSDKLCSSNKLVMLKEEDLIHGRYDRTRVVINVKALGITGFEADRILRGRFNIQVEMADLYNIVGIATIADKEEDFFRLYAALDQVSEELKNLAPLTDIYFKQLSIPEQRIELKEAMQCKGRKMELSTAVGKTSLQMITPYPPGVPVICPGEIILDDTVEYIYNIIKSGGIVQGVGDKMEVSVL